MQDLLYIACDVMAECGMGTESQALGKVHVYY